MLFAEIQRKPQSFISLYRKGLINLARMRLSIMKKGIQVKLEEDTRLRKLITLKRRDYCPYHDFKIMFFCQHPDCKSPYLCKHFDCIESHIHNDKLALTRVNSKDLATKTQNAQKMLLSHEKQLKKACLIKNAVDGYRVTLMDLFQELEDIRNINLAFKTNRYGDNMTVEDFKQMSRLNQKQKQLANGIQMFKKRMRTEPDKQVGTKEINKYLQKNIEGFDAEKAELLWDKSKSADKMPAAIEGKTNLLFLMTGQGKIVGFYTPAAYPSMQQKKARAPKSFVFLQQNTEDGLIRRFDASQLCDYHVLISDKQLICIGNMQNGMGDGVRSFSHDLSQFSYYLPTDAYLRGENGGDGSNQQFFAGKITVTELTIYQLHPIK